MNTKSDSLNRRALYTFLSEHSLDGSIIDLGGSLNASYHPEIKGNHTFTVVNIDTNYGYDIYADLEKSLPLENESYDHALLLNVLEHIYNYRTLMQEMHRILKPNATVLHITPFLVQEHGCPYDYFRYTKETLRLLYEEFGFEIVSIKPMEPGVFAMIYEITNFFVPFTWLRVLYRHSMSTLERMMRTYIKRYDAIADKFALSYMVVAKKK